MIRALVMAMASSLQEILNEIKRNAAMQPRTRTHSLDIALQGLDYAKKISPDETGNFKEAWSVRESPPRFEGDTPLFQLQNDDPGAVSIEYGTKDTPAHHTMASTRTYMQGLAAAEEHE